MLTASCRDVGMDCDYVCKGETEEKIMKKGRTTFVVAHIQQIKTFQKSMCPC